MSNALNINLKPGEVVILNKSDYSPQFWGDLRFECQSGFGMQASTIGRAIFGKWLVDGEQCRIDASIGIDVPATLAYWESILATL